jgi:hypothetical protein
MREHGPGPTIEVALTETAVVWIRYVLVAVSLITSVALAGSAAARHNARHDNDVSQSTGHSVEPTHSSPRGPLGVIMAQLMNDCEQQAAELKKFPSDEIAEAVMLDDTEADALKSAQNAAWKCWCEPIRPHNSWRCELA